MRNSVDIYVLVLFSIIVMQGCRENRNLSVLSAAGKTDTLNFSEIRLSQELTAPTRMLVSEDKVIIYQRKGDTLFTIIPNPLSGKCYSAGLKGRGPKEFIDIDVQSLSPCDEGFVCLDSDGKVKHVFVADNHIEVTEVAEFKYSNSPLNGIMTSEGYVSANIVNNRSEFIIYQGDDRPLYAGEYPKWASVDNEELPFAYMKNMIAHPEENIFAAFYVYFRRLRILDSNGLLIKDIDIRFPDNFPPYSSDYFESCLAYASYPSATAERIYALCCNRKVSRRGEVLPEIHVFDWSGELKRRLMLNIHIDIFATDDKNEIIYGCDVERPGILYFAKL